MTWRENNREAYNKYQREYAKTRNVASQAHVVKNNKRWTKDELEFVRDNSNMSAAQLSIELGRSQYSIRSVRRRYFARLPQPQHQ